MASRKLESESPYLVEVAHGAVGDHARAPEGAMDVGLHLAPLRTLPAGVVEIVDHDHARRRNREHVIPPAKRARAMVGHGLRLGPDERGHRVADEGAEIGKERPDIRRHLTLVTRANLEGLDGIGHAGAADLAECFDHVHLLGWGSGWRADLTGCPGAAGAASS